MSSNIPSEDPAPYFDRSWSSVLPPGGANLFHRSRLHLGIIFQETSNAILSGLDVIQDATLRYIHHASPRLATATEFRPVNADHTTPTDQEHEDTPGTPLRDYNRSLTPESVDLEEADQLVAVRDDGSIETPLARSRRSWMWVVALIVGLLLLIMVPGLILGIVTRQVAWGIAISGAVAPAVVFSGGLYYHHNK